MDIDVMATMTALARGRPVFHSERDLQQALAWQIQVSYPEAQIRLEPRPRRGIHLDMLVSLGGQRTAIELKYLVAALHATVGDELFDLPDQSAHDISRHDVVKDIARVEGLVADGYADNGYVLALTNDRNYWQLGARTDTIDAAFRIHDGRVLSGTLAWAERAGRGTTAKRDKPFHLVGQYNCRWQNYSQVTLTSSRTTAFRYLLIAIQPAAIEAPQTTIGGPSRLARPDRVSPKRPPRRLQAPHGSRSLRQPARWPTSPRTGRSRLFKS